MGIRVAIATDQAYINLIFFALNMSKEEFEIKKIYEIEGNGYYGEIPIEDISNIGTLDIGSVDYILNINGLDTQVESVLESIMSKKKILKWENFLKHFP